MKKLLFKKIYYVLVPTARACGACIVTHSFLPRTEATLWLGAAKKMCFPLAHVFLRATTAP